MPTPDFTLAGQYVQHIADQVAAKGIAVPDWLQQSGLPGNWLEAPRQGISLPIFERLVREAISMTREPAIGLLVGERLLVNTHGMLGYAAMSSVTIRQMLELFEHFIRLRIALITARHEVQADEVRLRFTEVLPLGDIRRPVLEGVLLAVKNIADFSTVGACRIAYVAFPFARPDYASLAEGLFKCEVRYGQSWAGFSMPPEQLDEPLKMADPAAFQEAALICRRELDKLSANESMHVRVQRVLLEKQNGFPSLAVTARLFNMTPRTLHRRLLQEGTCFQDILEQIRHTLALEHLKADRLTIQEIAYALGYTEIANFRRAFKRWQGVPPSEYRQHHAG